MSMKKLLTAAVLDISAHEVKTAFEVKKLVWIRAAKVSRDVARDGVRDAHWRNVRGGARNASAGGKRQAFNASDIDYTKVSERELNDMRLASRARPPRDADETEWNRVLSRIQAESARRGLGDPRQQRQTRVATRDNQRGKPEPNADTAVDNNTPDSKPTVKPKKTSRMDINRETLPKKKPQLTSELKKSREKEISLLTDDQRKSLLSVLGVKSRARTTRGTVSALSRFDSSLQTRQIAAAHAAADLLASSKSQRSSMVNYFMEAQSRDFWGKAVATAVKIAKGKKKDADRISPYATVEVPEDLKGAKVERLNGPMRAVTSSKKEIAKILTDEFGFDASKLNLGQEVQQAQEAIRTMRMISHVMGVDPKAMSGNGRLKLSLDVDTRSTIGWLFGGSQENNGFFNPGISVLGVRLTSPRLALAKGLRDSTSIRSTLAHEYAHFFDNALAGFSGMASTRFSIPRAAAAAAITGTAIYNAPGGLLGTMLASYVVPSMVMGWLDPRVRRTSFEWMQPKAKKAWSRISSELDKSNISKSELSELKRLKKQEMSAFEDEMLGDLADDDSLTVNPIALGILGLSEMGRIFRRWRRSSKDFHTRLFEIEDKYGNRLSMKDRAVIADASSGQGSYYQLSVELFARAFEANLMRKMKAIGIDKSVVRTFGDGQSRGSGGSLFGPDTFGSDTPETNDPQIVAISHDLDSVFESLSTPEDRPGREGIAERVAESALGSAGRLQRRRSSQQVNAPISTNGLSGLSAKQRKDFDNIAKSLGSSEKQSLSVYSGQGYTQVNEYLRRGTVLQDNGPGNAFTPASSQAAERVQRALDKAVADIDAAIDTSELPADGILYRGLKLTNVEQMQPGTIWRDNSFSSVSSNANVAAGFTRTQGKDGALVVIQAKAGQKALSMRRISASSGEDELILPRGSQFRTVSVENRRLPGGLRSGTVVTVEIVSDGSKAMAEDRDGEPKDTDKKSDRSDRFGVSQDDLEIVKGNAKKSRT